MKKFLKITLIIIGAISLIFVALIGIGLFVDVEYDDHIENGRYTYVPEEENKDNGKWSLLITRDELYVQEVEKN